MNLNIEHSFKLEHISRLSMVIKKLYTAKIFKNNLALHINQKLDNFYLENFISRTLETRFTIKNKNYKTILSTLTYLFCLKKSRKTYTLLIFG